MQINVTQEEAEYLEDALEHYLSMHKSTIGNCNDVDEVQCISYIIQTTCGLINNVQNAILDEGAAQRRDRETLIIRIENVENNS